MSRYNIYLRKDGRWEGRLYKTLENGTRKYKSFFGISREAVVQKMDAYMKSQDKAEKTPLTVNDLFRGWFQQMRYRIKESTSANYMMKANKHILPCFGNRYAEDISSDEISLFIEDKRNKGLSDRYISDIIALMRSIFKYASRVYHVSNPLDGIRMSKKKQPEIRLLDRVERKKLEQYVFENRNPTAMGIALSMITGIRIGELCALQWKDVDLKKRILTVRKTIQRIQYRNGSRKTKLIITEPKSESSQRTIPIPDFMIDYLAEFRKDEGDYLLSGNEKPVEPRTMQYRFARILHNVNLPSVHFHSLRHSFASDCIRLGFDIKTLSELLGHGSVEITLNQYVHSSFEQKQEYMNRIRLSA